jgi:CRP/FNR family transcriptional regulator/CRP/FNR family cyclic AMP-dependent transcriptional regulator
MPVVIDAQSLARVPLLKDVSLESLTGLTRSLRRRGFHRGEVIFHQGDPGDTLHIIGNGRVKIVLPAETGDEVVLAVLGPGDCFGELALLDGGPRSASVVAMESVETWVLGRQDFLLFFRSNIEAAERLIINLSRTIRRTNEDVADLAFLDLPGRLAKKLLDLAESYGQQQEGSKVIEITVPLTQEELASMIGATRPSVNKVLGLYEDQGAIQRRGRRIAILRPDVLRRRVY